jgi:hypothetical protein
VREVGRLLVDPGDPGDPGERSRRIAAGRERLRERHAPGLADAAWRAAALAAVGEGRHRGAGLRTAPAE